MADPSQTYPKTTVKKIVKLDPEIKQMGSEAVDTMAAVARLFVAVLSAKSADITSSEKKKTISLAHVVQAIRSMPEMDFLEGAMDVIMTPAIKKAKPLKPKPTGFMIFCSEKRGEVYQNLKSNNAAANFTETAVKLGEIWQIMTDEEKKVYNDKAVEQLNIEVHNEEDAAHSDHDAEQSGRDEADNAMAVESEVIMVDGEPPNKTQEF